MKVLQTIGGFGAKSGGTSTCTYDLLSAMHTLKPEPKIDLLTPTVKATDDRLMGDGEEWIKAVGNDYRTPVAYSKNMTRFLRESDYDVYHTNGMWMHINHETCAAARRKGKPYVITPHGMLYPETLARSVWKKWIVKKLWFNRDIREASCFHATCEEEMQHLRTFGYRGPVAIIGNPVGVPAYTDDLIYKRNYKQNNVLTIGFLGRLHPRKKVHHILVGMAESNLSNVRLLIMGQGSAEYEQYLHSEVNRLRLNDRVEFLGFVRGREKFERLASLDALFVPSDMENFGMIIPEALIVGTPVMASLGTPWRALNEQQCGWWRDNSPSTIAEIINNLATIPAEELHAMGYRGREYVLRTYAAEKVARQMLDLYKWLAGETPKPEFVYEK